MGNNNFPPGVGAVKGWLIATIARCKPYLGWGLLAAAMAVLAHTTMLHWAEVVQLQPRSGAWRWLTLAFATTLLAHLWNGWVWSWILHSLQQPVDRVWAALVYLRTNIWKYLPGNVWHFYGLLHALKTRAVPTGTALAGVALDPLLMAAAALLLGLLTVTQYWFWSGLGLVALLVMLQPRWLNPLVVRVSAAKGRSTGDDAMAPPEGLRHYPIKPLVGKMGFVLLRAIGFGLAVLALSPVAMQSWLPLVSRFSLAWCVGLVVPGAPGGIGVFEALAVSLLQGQLTAGVVLGAVALYRFISILTELISYGMAVLTQRMLLPAP